MCQGLAGSWTCISGRRYIQDMEWSGRQHGYLECRVTGNRIFGGRPVEDTSCEKGGGALSQKFQIYGFWPVFYI